MNPSSTKAIILRRYNFELSHVQISFKTLFTTKTTHILQGETITVIQLP